MDYRLFRNSNFSLDSCIDLVMDWFYKILWYHTWKFLLCVFACVYVRVRVCACVCTYIRIEPRAQGMLSMSSTTELYSKYQKFLFVEVLRYI
jgi:hypothetical protein